MEVRGTPHWPVTPRIHGQRHGPPCCATCCLGFGPGLSRSRCAVAPEALEAPEAPELLRTEAPPLRAMRNLPPCHFAAALLRG